MRKIILIRYLGTFVPILTIPIVIGSSTVWGQTLKLATLAPEGSGWVQTLRKIDRDVRDRTKGAVNLKIFPGGVLGDEDVMIRKIRIGQLHGGGFGGTGVSAIFRDVVALEMPFLFDSYEEIEYVLDEMEGYYKAGYANNGYVLLGWADVGFVHLFSQRPIAAVDDIRGVKVWRLQGEPVTEVLFNKVGVSSVPLGIPDVLLGLQTGLVEVVYASPVAAIVLQWFTRVSHFTTLPINYALGALLVDQRAFDRLSPANQQILAEVAKEQMHVQRQQSRADNDEALRVITAQGVKSVHVPDSEIAAFKELIVKSVPDLKGHAFSHKSYDRVQFLLRKYREEQRRE